jgi:hypothetical protein
LFFVLEIRNNYTVLNVCVSFRPAHTDERARAELDIITVTCCSLVHRKQLVAFTVRPILPLSRGEYCTRTWRVSGQFLPAVIIVSTCNFLRLQMERGDVAVSTRIRKMSRSNSDPHIDSPGFSRLSSGPPRQLRASTSI